MQLKKGLQIPVHGLLVLCGFLLQQSLTQMLSLFVLANKGSAKKNNISSNIKALKIFINLLKVAT
jgi:hypothetical protein